MNRRKTENVILGMEASLLVAGAATCAAFVMNRKKKSGKKNSKHTGYFEVPKQD